MYFSSENKADRSFKATVSYLFLLRIRRMEREIWFYNQATAVANTIIKTY
jgi:hypothetical protein